MSKTSIEWTEEAWNPTTGCDRISPGCDNCYALTMAKRLKGMGQAKYQQDGDPRTSGPGFGLAVHEDTLTIPLDWKKPRRVFVNSMSDLFHARVPLPFIHQVFSVMARTPQHTYQILTKRPGRMTAVMSRDSFPFLVYNITGEPLSWPLGNVWLGTSVESAKYLHRVDALRAAPAVVRFVSAEPLLGSLDGIDLTGIDWVIVGGESGAGARPMELAWARSLRDQCVAAGVPLFFKQWGNWVPPSQMTEDTFRDWDFHHGTGMWDMDQSWRVGKKRAGRLLDGREWNEMPA